MTEKWNLNLSIFSVPLGQKKVQARAVFYPLTGKGAAVTMCYRTLYIGSGTMMFRDYSQTKKSPLLWTTLSSFITIYKTEPTNVVFDHFRLCRDEDLTKEMLSVTFVCEANLKWHVDQQARFIETCLSINL